MGSRAEEGLLTVVDACCWLDLFATGRIEEIVRALPYRLATSRFVAENEVLTVASASGGEERCDFAKLRESRLVSVWDVETSEEKRELVRYAAYLDDGEASVCALAIARQGAVATDDRKAIRTLARLAPEVLVLQTPELFHKWAEVAHPPAGRLREVLGAVQSGARFRPGRDAPFSSWWTEALTGVSE